MTDPQQVELSPEKPMIASAPDVAPEIPDFPGVVTSRHSRVVSADFQGRVDRIQVYAGQKVRAGDPIAKLDEAQLKTQILTAKSQESAAIARARGAGAGGSAAALAVKRERYLNRTGVSSPARLQEAMAQAGQAGGNYQAEMDVAKGHRAERERLEALLAKAQVTAPIEGIVTTIRVKEGELAQQGQPIVRVLDPKDVIMRFAVPKEHRQRFALGKRVEIKIEGVDHSVWATVERIADEEPPLNFAVVDADIDDSKLRPDEIRVTAQGRVRIADASAGGKR